MKLKWLVNFVSKPIMSTTVQSRVLDIESRGSKALDTFVNERIRGEKNMWYKMPKLDTKQVSDQGMI